MASESRPPEKGNKRGPDPATSTVVLHPDTRSFQALYVPRKDLGNECILIYEGNVFPRGTVGESAPKMLDEARPSSSDGDADNFIFRAIVTAADPYQSILVIRYGELQSTLASDRDYDLYANLMKQLQKHNFPSGELFFRRILITDTGDDHLITAEDDKMETPTYKLPPEPWQKMISGGFGEFIKDLFSHFHLKRLQVGFGGQLFFKLQAKTGPTMLFTQDAIAGPEEDGAH